MLESLQLSNFQRHHRLRIDFDSEVTAIVGPNGSGKTAIIRALRWIMFNRPAGDSVIRHGTDQAIVITVIDGQKIGRKKGKGGNAYRIGKTELKAFGSDVPQEIADLLNVNEINFQRQHDSPYWLSETAGQVGRELNRIVDLEVIDGSLARIGSRLRKARTAAEIAQDRLASSREAKEGLAWVLGAAEDLSRVRSHFEKLEQTLIKIENLGRLIQGVSKVVRNRDRRNLIAKVGTELIEIGKNAVGLSERVRILEGLISQARYTRSVVDRGLPNMASLDGMMNRVRENSQQITGVEALIMQLRIQTDEMNRARENHQRAEKKLNQKMGGRCPLCGSPMSQK